jgi:hypothetical protein
MAKANSPIRLQAELMQAATLTGARMHRSAAEQIEYWADLGRQVAALVDPDVVLKIQAGLVRLRVESIRTEPLDPDDVFATVEADRVSGALADRVTAAPIRYQASTSHPGYLERIDAEGKRTPGRFQDGVFVALAAEA